MRVSLRTNPNGHTLSHTLMRCIICEQYIEEEDRLYCPDCYYLVEDDDDRAYESYIESDMDDIENWVQQALDQMTGMDD